MNTQSCAVLVFSFVFPSQAGQILRQAKPGLLQMEYGHPSDLSYMCDMYLDPRLCDVGGARTSFNVGRLEATIELATLALNFYNQKNHKNFNLEEVVKLNRITGYYCMTFRARNAESDECFLFRGAVYVIGGDKVLLCEIKDDKEISIPADHDEYYDRVSSRDPEDISPYTWDKNDDGDDGSAVFTYDVNTGIITKAPP